MKPLSGKKLLIMSVACGVIAAILAVVYLKAQEAKYRNKYQPQKQRTVKVIVPNQNIAKSERVTKDKVSGLTIPEQFAPSKVVLVEDWPQLQGKMTLSPLEVGRPITWTAIEGQTTKTFSENIQLGGRAKTVKISRINSFDGLLRPGDHVDLYGSFEGGEIGIESGDADTSSKIVLSILENVVVLAAGREDSSGRKYDLTRDKTSADGFNMNFSTVTLSLTPRQSAKVELAEQIGDLVAFLRHPKDTSLAKLDYLPAVSLLEEDPVETVDMVFDENGNAVGRVVGDNIVDENGNIVGKVVNGKAVSLDGKELGAIVKNVSQDSSQQIAEIADVVRDENGNIIGRINKNGEIVNEKGEVIGKVDESGKAVALDGTSLGTIEKNVAFDENGNVVSNNQVAEIADVVRDENGNVIGKIVDGKVVDENGNVIGEVKNGKAVALDGSSLGTIEENVALDSSGNIIQQSPGPVSRFVDFIAGGTAEDGVIKVKKIRLE